MILPKVWPVTCHTDYVGKNTIFVAIKGDNFDGVNYISKAINLGAKEIVISNKSILDKNLINLINSKKIKLTKVGNTRKYLSFLSAKKWNTESNLKKIKLIAVTGTKGKTSSVFYLRFILKSLGYKTAIVSGVFNYINDNKFQASLTTPQPDYLHMFLAQCIKYKIDYFITEASAQALSLYRLDDFKFDSVIFTNLEQEHAEFYNNINKYFEAKCLIFKLLKNINSSVILNLDNNWANKLNNSDLAKNNLFNIYSFSNSKNKKNNKNLLSFNINNNYLDGLDFNILDLNNKINFKFKAKNLWGEFNIYNLAGAILCLKSLNININNINSYLNKITSAPGRLEKYKLNNNSWAIVDYAHTPSSFKAVLSLLRKLSSELIVVFGASGDRDKVKRPIMGKIASEIADKIIITTDNPRSEKLETINKSILAGINKSNLNKVTLEPDRARAIALSINIIKHNSINNKKKLITVILGKGPDEYQQIGPNKFFFSDKQEVIKNI